MFCILTFGQKNEKVKSKQWYCHLNFWQVNGKPETVDPTLLIASELIEL